MTGEVVHIAGLDVEVGHLLRQRCAWCDAILVDYDLRRVAIAASTADLSDRRPATWPVGALVAVDGGYSTVREHSDGDQLPMNACVPLSA